MPQPIARLRSYRPLRSSPLPPEPPMKLNHSSINARRRSDRSVRRYAAATQSEFTRAKAISQTSRGASEHSAAQSRNDERKPCGTASIPSSRSSLEIVLLLSARPCADGNTSSESSDILGRYIHTLQSNPCADIGTVMRSSPRSRRSTVVCSRTFRRQMHRDRNESPTERYASMKDAASISSRTADRPCRLKFMYSRSAR